MSKPIDNYQEALDKYFKGKIDNVLAHVLDKLVEEKKITKSLSNLLKRTLAKEKKAYNKKDKVLKLINDIKNKSIKKILEESSLKNIDVDIGNGIIENRSYRGFVYERLWDICIKFGVVDNLTKKNNKGDTEERKEIETYNTCHLFGNLNRDTIDFNNNCWVGGQFKNYLDENIQSGNSGGYSDISFINKETDKETDKEDVYFISVKYYEKGKSIDSYDIGKLCTMIEKHQKGKVNRNIHILLFVKDKKTLIEKFKNQQKSSDIMMKYIDPSMDQSFPNIYDETDLEQSIYKLKLLLDQYNYLEDDISKRVFEEEYLKILKSPFIPRFHQKLFIDKINELILKDNEKNILVGAIPRSGKSYIMMGSILEYVKQMKLSGNTKKLNFILVTPAPNETFGEYNDIFNTYIDFDTLGINKVLLKDNRTKNPGNPDKHNLFIVSKQMLGYKEKTDKVGKDNDEVRQDINMIKKQTDERIKKLLGEREKFDLILLDEAHFGMSTQNAQEILNVLDGLGKDTPKMFVTATYNKPLSVYGINAEKCKLTWDINDVQMFKETDFDINNNSIRDRFGHKIYDDSLKFFNNDVEKIKDSYQMYPKPYLMTSLWDYQYLQQEKAKLDMGTYGFDMDKLFTVEGGVFTNKEQMIQMMRYYFGYPDKKLSYGKQHIYRQRGILPRIQKICAKDNCRTMQDPNHFTTQLWFLPYGPNRKIVDIVNALITLFKYAEFNDIKEKYHFYVAVDVKGVKDTSIATYMEDSHNIKKEIQNLEKEKNKNIIVLAGARLQLGISLRNVDIVTLWNMVTSSDAIFQMLFRSMTEVNVPRCKEDVNFCPEKKYGFMVDLNPQRALTNTLLFGENLTSKKSEGKSKYELIADCINIDEDVFQDKFDNDGDKKEFVNQLFNKLYGSWDKNVDDMRKLTEKVLKYDEGVLQSIEHGLRMIKLGKKKGKDIVQEADEGFDPSEKGKKDEGEKGKKETKKEKELKKIPLSQLAAEVISELVSLLNIFSLYTKSDNVDCILTSGLLAEDVEEERQLNIISDINDLKKEIFSEHKEIFLEILNGRLGGSYDEMYDEGLLNLILDSVLKVSSEKENNLYAINKLVMSQKKKYYTIREPNKLLEYINDNLAPKEKEKKEAGEVFTPISIVEEMLDKLPKEVWSKHDYKWLDPAVGIGNFPICAYLRLMEGLKSWEPNEEKRRKHILEKMLYMVEISKKSIMILNKVFCGDKYKLNIFEGSFVENRDTNTGKYILFEKFDDGTNTFDVVMGNPPYNFIFDKRSPVYQLFCLKGLELLNENGYLNFIIPNAWKRTYTEIAKTKTGLILDTYKKYNFVYLKLNLKIPHFPKVDILVIKKSNTSNNTTVQHYDSKLNYEGIIPKDVKFLPDIITNESLSIINKIINKSGEKLSIINDRSITPNTSIKDTDDKKHIYKVYNFTDKNNKTHFKFSEKITKDYKHSKIIMSFNKSPKILNAFHSSGNIGTTDLNMFMVDLHNNLKYLPLFLNSKLIKFILCVSQYASPPNEKNDFKILNLITYPDKVLKTDEDIYKYYGITKAEQKLIDDVVNYVKPSKKDKKTKTKSKDSIEERRQKEQDRMDADPKLQGQVALRDDFEPEPEPEPIKSKTKSIKSKSKSKSPRPNKTVKKSKCSKSHPEPPCKPGMYDKNGCCYKGDKKTKKKSKGGRRYRQRRGKRTKKKSRMRR